MSKVYLESSLHNDPFVDFAAGLDQLNKYEIVSINTLWRDFLTYYLLILSPCVGDLIRVKNDDFVFKLARQWAAYLFTILPSKPTLLRNNGQIGGQVAYDCRIERRICL